MFVLSYRYLTIACNFHCFSECACWVLPSNGVWFVVPNMVVGSQQNSNSIRAYHTLLTTKIISQSCESCDYLHRLTSLCIAIKGWGLWCGSWESGTKFLFSRFWFFFFFKLHYIDFQYTNSHFKNRTFSGPAINNISSEHVRNTAHIIFLQCFSFLAWVLRTLNWDSGEGQLHSSW